MMNSTISNTRSNKQGVLLIVLSTLAFGSYGVWARLIGNSLGIFYQSWARSLLIALILLPMLLYKKEFVFIKIKYWRWLFVFLIFTSLTQAPIFYAYNHMDIATASLIYFVSTLLTMYAVGFAFLEEKVNTVKSISFLVACVGLFFIFSVSIKEFSLLAASMALLNGIASGGELAFSKKLTNVYSPLFIVWLSWIIIALTNGPVSLFMGEHQVLPELSLPWLYLGGYAVASIFGFWLVIAGMKYVEASISGLLGLLEIVFSVAFGIFLFGEALTLKVVLGMGLILIAAALPHLFNYFDSSYKNSTVVL